MMLIMLVGGFDAIGGCQQTGIGCPGLVRHDQIERLNSLVGRGDVVALSILSGQDSQPRQLAAS